MITSTNRIQILHCLSRFAYVCNIYKSFICRTMVRWDQEFPVVFDLHEGDFWDGETISSARTTWYRRWTCTLACSTVKEFASVRWLEWEDHQEQMIRCHLSMRSMSDIFYSLIQMTRSFDSFAVVFSFVSQQKIVKTIDFVSNLLQSENWIFQMSRRSSVYHMTNINFFPLNVSYNTYRFFSKTRSNHCRK